MQTVAKSNFVLTEVASLNWLAGLHKQTSHAAFYQQITRGLAKGFHTRQILAGLGDNLIALAEHAFKLRRVDIVEQASQFLLALPLSGEYQNIGLYYEAAALNLRGRFTDVRSLLERLIEKLPQSFRAKSLTALSSSYLVTGDFRSSLSLCIEAGRAAICNDLYDPQSIIISQRNIAIIKSITGNHPGALADLEKTLPLVRMLGRWQPYLFYEQLNSYAVELGEVGRIQEAKNICKIVLASPYASAYPEWRETWNELQIRGYHTPRSFVPVRQKASYKENVVDLPVSESNADRQSTPNQSGKPARLLNFVDWKEKMVNEPDDNSHNDKPSEELDEREKLLRIIQLASSRDRTEGELDSILKAIEEIISADKDENKK